jgi:four helix bundle protein
MKFDFQKLEVYKKAKLFYALVLPIVKSKKINKTIADQLNRAAFSITLNIAEGSGRFSKADRRNFFTIARSSVFECVAIFDILQEQSFVSAEVYEVIENQADELSRMLYSMIKNLQH